MKSLSDFRSRMENMQMDSGCDKQFHFHSFHFIIFIQVKGSYIYMFFNLTCFKRLK